MPTLWISIEPSENRLRNPDADVWLLLIGGKIIKETPQPKRGVGLRLRSIWAN